MIEDPNVSYPVQTFEQAVDRQDYLQSFVFNKDGISPANFSDEGKIRFIKDNILALEDELHELLGEIGWKPWASSRHINRDAYVGELVDAFHFFMNLMIVTNISVDELLKRYEAKSLKNVKRQEDGYDGVTGKCPICKRALDDDAVMCTVEDDDEAGLTWGYCAAENRDWAV